MTSTKELLEAIVAGVQRQRAAKLDTDRATAELGALQRGRIKNGSKRFQLKALHKVVILTHHPNAKDGTGRWSASVLDLSDEEVVE